MIIQEAELTEEITEQLISLSEDWENEGICQGYYKNTIEDIKGNRVFLALEDGEILGYLFGHRRNTQMNTSYFREGEPYFEVEELYVKPAHRSRGIGRALFQHVEELVAGDVDLLMLNTDTKNWRAILHFYIEEMGMDFWNARLIKKIK